MPIGITTDVLITCLGAVLGVVLGTRLPDSLKKALNNTLGIAAIAMGIVLILKVKNLSAVVLTLVIGSILGELVMLDDRIRKLVTGVVHKLMNGAAADEQFLAQVSAVVILFCCGGTGWYGALNEGLTGDGSILITKSILDFVTACIFGSILGKIVPMLCIPQAIIYGALPYATRRKQMEGFLNGIRRGTVLYYARYHCRLFRNGRYHYPLCRSQPGRYQKGYEGSEPAACAYPDFPDLKRMDCTDGIICH